MGKGRPRPRVRRLPRATCSLAEEASVISGSLRVARSPILVPRDRGSRTYTLKLRLFSPICEGILRSR